MRPVDLRQSSLSQSQRQNSQDEDGNVIKLKCVPLTANWRVTLYTHDDLMGGGVYFPVYTW